MQSEAERNVRVVIRIFQYIGWPFAVLFSAISLFGIPLIAIASLSDGFQTIVADFVMCSSLLLVTAFFVAVLLVARTMKARDPASKVWATILSILMLPMFPLFTVVGLICLYKIRTYYDQYCHERPALAGELPRRVA